MRRRLAWLVTALTVALLDQCFAEELASASGFTSTSRTFTAFKTEPTIKTEVFDIQRIVEDKSRLAPGYLFVDPIWERFGWGPQIYTMDGTLIWQGPSRYRSQNLHVCDYLGEKGTHLCYSMRFHKRVIPESIGGPAPRPEARYSWNRVVDQTYQLLTPHYLRAAAEDLPLNTHAWETVENGYSGLNLYGRPEKMDLRHYGGPEDGWVSNQCMEEVDLRTAESVFHWCYLQSGLKVWETKIFFNITEAWNAKHPINDTAQNVGHGDVKMPWDFLHLNSVDKNAQGDYYISARHLDQIIKIAGPKSATGAVPGTILWRMGGHGNNFTFSGFPLPDAPPFSRPHDIRAMSASGSEEVISLLNNGYGGVLVPSQNYSDAQYIHVNTDTMTATLLRNYPHPKGTLSPGRGSVQQLPNGNVLVGWGKVPEFTEFDGNGTVLAHTHFKRPGVEDPEFSYRVLKSPWIGKPKADPKLVVEAHDRAKRLSRGAALNAYVSWNGATEVASWRFWVWQTPGGAWRPLGVFRKDGFETTAKLPRPACPPSHILVEGLDAAGAVLGSAMAQPRAGSDWACRHVTVSSFLGLFFAVLTVEAFIYLAHCMCYLILYRNSQHIDFTPLAGEKA